MGKSISFVRYANLAEKQVRMASYPKNEDEAFAQAIEFFTNMHKKLPNILRDLKKRDISDDVVHTSHTMAQLFHEHWYRYFFK